MTYKQALAEAHRRWGKGAMIEHNRAYTALPYMVGHCAPGMMFHVKGQGTSWQSAFDDADRKAKL